MPAAGTAVKLVRLVVATKSAFCSRAGSRVRGHVTVFKVLVTVRVNGGGGGSAARTDDTIEPSANPTAHTWRICIKEAVFSYNMNESTRLTSELSVTAPDGRAQ